MLATFTGCSREPVEPEIAAPEKPPARSITVAELFAAYVEDEQAAEEEFDEQLLEVRGVVRRVGFTPTHTGVALLVEDQMDRKLKIECEICGTMGDGREYGNFDAMERLAPRQEIVIRGVCHGFASFGGSYVSLVNCELIDLRAAPPAATSEIDGRWHSDNILYDGEPDNWLKQATWEIRGDEIFVTDYRENVISFEIVERATNEYDAWITIDPEQDPPQITYETRRKDDSLVEVFGIYMLEGDTLTVCYSDRDERRPTDFESTPESHRYLVVFERKEEN